MYSSVKMYVRRIPQKTKPRPTIARNDETYKAANSKAVKPTAKKVSETIAF